MRTTVLAAVAGTVVAVAWGTPMNDPEVIAHRGASAYAPEHTFAAWDLALEMGADYLEQDLQMTADGVLVVLHDETLDRTARGPENLCTGPVGDRMWQQLQVCEVGSWFDERFRDQRIPSLREVFARYADRARFYIETKSPEDAPGMEEALAALLLEFDLVKAAGPAKVVLQSFHPGSLLRLQELVPELPRVQLVPRATSAWEARERLAEVATYADGIGPHHERVDRALVDAAHDHGLIVHPYTVNTTPEMERLAGLGVDGMFTDRPDVLRRVFAAGSGP